MAIEISESQLVSIMPVCHDAPGWCAPLNSAMARFEIADNAYRVAAFLAQCAHESQELNRLVENLNYSAAALMRTWPKRFPTLGGAEAYARQPERIANRVYAGRLGNGDEPSGDGWRYRGRGLIQVTGRGTYRETGAALALPLAAQPELLEQAANAALSAAWFWKSHLLNPLADHHSTDIDDADFVTITTKINGGKIGLAARRAFWVKARVALGIA